MYYRGAAAAVVVYDITSEQSFERAKKWIAELRQLGSAEMVIAVGTQIHTLCSLLPMTVCSRQ